MANDQQRLFAGRLAAHPILGAVCAGLGDIQSDKATPTGFYNACLAAMIDCLAPCGITAATLPGRGLGFDSRCRLSRRIWPERPTAGARGMTEVAVAPEPVHK